MEEKTRSRTLSLVVVVISIVVGALTIFDKVHFYTFSKASTRQAELRAVMSDIVAITLKNVEDGYYDNPTTPSRVQIAQAGLLRTLVERGAALVESLEDDAPVSAALFFAGQYSEMGDWENFIAIYERELPKVARLSDRVAVLRDLGFAYYQVSDLRDIERARALAREALGLIARLDDTYHMQQFNLLFPMVIRAELMFGSCDEVNAWVEDYLVAVRAHRLANPTLVAEAERYAAGLNAQQAVCRVAPMARAAPRGAAAG